MRRGPTPRSHSTAGLHDSSGEVGKLNWSPAERVENDVPERSSSRYRCRALRGSWMMTGVTGFSVDFSLGALPPESAAPGMAFVEPPPPGSEDEESSALTTSDAAEVSAPTTKDPPNTPAATPADTAAAPAATGAVTSAMPALPGHLQVLPLIYLVN